MVNLENSTNNVSDTIGYGQKKVTDQGTKKDALCGCFNCDRDMCPRIPNKSSRKHFKTLSLDELRSLDFNLFSNQEYSEEEVAGIMTETMEQYMTKTQADYGSGVARPKIEDEDNFELKGQFLKELRTNTFSGSDHEDAKNTLRKFLRSLIYSTFQVLL
ncbi:hypothetical protein Tco_0657897 [Tanacetum coccineum]